MRVGLCCRHWHSHRIGSAYFCPCGVTVLGFQSLSQCLAALTLLVGQKVAVGMTVVSYNKIISLANFVLSATLNVCELPKEKNKCPQSSFCYLGFVLC